MGAIFCACIVSVTAHAGVRLQAKLIAADGMQFKQVHLQLANAADGTLKISMDAASARVPALGWHDVGVHLVATAVREDMDRWQLQGHLQLARAPGGLMRNGQVQVVLDAGANTLEVAVTQAKAKASADLPLDLPTHAQVSLSDVPLSWLQGVLGSVWAGGELKAGRLDGQIAVDVLDQGVHASGQFALNGVGVDSRGGAIAAQGVRATGRLSLDTSARPVQVNLDASLSHGELLLGPLYARLPAHAVHVAMDAQAGPAGLSLRNLEVTDPDALRLAGRIDFDTGGNLARLDLRRMQASFPAAYQRYARSWLDQAGFENLSIRGSLSGRVALGPKGLTRLGLHPQHLDVTDAQGRFAVDDLDGGLEWGADGSYPATQLSWRALKLYRIPNAAATIHWRTHNGVLALTQALSVPVLGGALTVPQFDWRPRAAKGQRVDMALTLTGIDLKSLCQAFGWPQFPGTLAGSIPGLRYQNGRFDLDGGLSLNVFGGYVDVTRLSLQSPFGSTPVLVGDMDMKQLDLAQMTSVFDFGSITGHVHGQVHGLRLVNWAPVAFDAQLLADGGGRISQRAVDNLTSVGGGGVAAGLQGMVLKLFKSFGYRRIGLSCRLEGAVCHMAGLTPKDGGFLIVEGRGLPHLSVIGHQSRVSWPTLIERLRAATHGAAPEVR